VTVGRRDVRWESGDTWMACYSVRVPVSGTARLYYAPDAAEAETWVYRFDPDPDDRHEALVAVVEAGGLSGPVDTRRTGSMVAVPLWATVRAHSIDSWMLLDESDGTAALAAVGMVEALIPEGVWGEVMLRRRWWHRTRTRAIRRCPAARVGGGL
jgi:hypothetical protein